MNLTRLLFVLAAVTVPALSAAAEPTEPERVLLTWNGDPARSQAVTWRTGQPVEQALAELAPALPGPKLAAGATSVTATSQAVETTAGVTVHYHSASFANLKPATKYAYRVGDGKAWSEWNHFFTASEKAEPFSFLYVGDAQNDVKSLWSRVIRDAFRHGSQAKFILHAGDLINIANRDNEWAEWFEAAGWINRVIPSIAIPGNHEYFLPAKDEPRQLSRLWQPQFEYPRNGPEGLEDTCYYLDYQGARIIALNSNERAADQAAWLDKVLSDNPNRWTILTFHHPIYSGAARRDNPQLRAAWLPVIDKHRVDLVLQGHDHTYARTEKLDGGSVVGSTANGTVYVVSVGGPKMYDTTTESAHLMARVAEDTQLYQLVTIKDDLLQYEAHTAAGDLYDAFDLRKGSGGKGNELINRIPEAVVERRRRREPEAAHKH